MTKPPADARLRPAASPRRPARWIAVAAFAACTGAQAAPDLLPDAVARFLAERGLAIEEQASAGLLDRARSRASDLVLSALNFLGVPYRRGGESQEQGFDCSGFTRHVVELTLGRVLPRRSNEQATAAGLVAVPRDELAPGDLVFFNTLRHAFSHVGIYIGDGKFVHAPRSGSNVRVEDMRGSYWVHRFDGARRVPAQPDGLPS